MKFAIVILWVVASVVRGEVAVSNREAARLDVYVGTYTGTISNGIYHARFDAAHGSLESPQLAVMTRHPSFLALHPSGCFLYAVNELGQEEATVSAYARDLKSGALTPLNTQPTRGAAPCHLAVDPSGRMLIAVNYGGGSTIAYPLGDDGRIGPSSAFVAHGATDGTPSPARAHGIAFDDARGLVYVTDLGLDAILIYRFDAPRATLEPAAPPLRLAPGSGPRHLVMDARGERLWVLNEHASTITLFSRIAINGALTERQTLSTLPAGFSGKSSTAEIVLHPTGRFLYASNRGHDSIAVFAVGADGRLTVIEHVATGGGQPRSFTLDPSGNYLLVANQASDLLCRFRVDASTGRLTAITGTTGVGSPVCLLMAPSLGVGPGPAAEFPIDRAAVVEGDRTLASWVYTPSEKGREEMEFVPSEGAYRSKGGRIESPAIPCASDPDAFYRLRAQVQLGEQGYYAIFFQDADGKNQTDDIYGRIDASTAWREEAFCFRGREGAVSFRLQFISHGTIAVRAVEVAQVSPTQVCAWADARYATLPPLPAASAAGSAWSLLPRTRQRLREGGNLRVVLLGDSIVNDTNNSNWDALVMRRYPRCRIRAVGSVRGSTGCWYYRDEAAFASYVTARRPELLLIGGISQKGDLEAIEAVVRRAQATLDCDILLMSGPFGKDWRSKESAEQPQAWPGDPFNVQLAALAARLKVAYLDIGSDWQRYLGASRRPWMAFHRDEVHADDNGKQILARLLERFFAAPEATECEP